VLEELLASIDARCAPGGQTPETFVRSVGGGEWRSASAYEFSRVGSHRLGRRRGGGPGVLSARLARTRLDRRQGADANHQHPIALGCAPLRLLSISRGPGIRLRFARLFGGAQEADTRGCLPLPPSSAAWTS
jgi:hypothetical protein